MGQLSVPDIAVIYKTTPPPTNRLGQLWMDTSVNPGVLNEAINLSPLTYQVVAGGGGGTVTSVAVASASSLSVAGSPIVAAGTITLDYLPNSVTNAVLAQAPARTLKGNATAALANESDLTVAQVKALLNYTAGDIGVPYPEDGIPGEDGAPGAAGPTGTTGATGPAGTAGPAGPPGEDGAPGEDGVAGSIGLTGPQGIAGRDVVGEDGTPGEDGIPGSIGLTGPQGIAGRDVVGEDGTPGEDGIPGSIGLTGPQGIAGPAIPGEDGFPGDDGIPGAIGATGATGATGAAGTSVTFGLAPITLIGRRSGTVLLDVNLLQRQVGKAVIVTQAPKSDEDEHAQLLCTGEILNPRKLRVRYICVGGVMRGTRTLNYVIAA